MTNEFQKPFTAPPVIFIVAFVIGFGIDLIYPLPTLPLGLQLGAGVASVIVGVLLIRSSMASIERAGTTYNPFSASTVLVTRSIYRYTRNPGYLGLAMIQLGLALMFDSPWILLTTIAAVIVINQFVVKLEEEKLRRAFGKEYQNYLTDVRRWI